MDVAQEIDQQTRSDINKGTYRLHQHEAPFTRLLALEIILSAWLGWILNEKDPDKTKPFSAPDCFKTIQAAYDYGQKLSDKYHTKSIKQIILEEPSPLLSVNNCSSNCRNLLEGCSNFLKSSTFSRTIADWGCI
jgi:hypothetical protein